MKRIAKALFCAGGLLLVYTWAFSPSLTRLQTKQNPVLPALHTTESATVPMTAPEQATQQQQPPKSCPLVFIYNKTQLLKAYGEEFSVESWGVPNQNLGRKRYPWLHTTDQHVLGGLMMDRLTTSSRCTTDNPELADLFIVPMIIEKTALVSIDEENQHYAVQPPSVELEMWPLCKRWMDEDWHATLPHLNDRTASRHVFLQTKFFQLYGFCMNIERFRDRVQTCRNAAFLKRMAHLANSPYSVGWAPEMKFYSMAYPSCVHLRRAEIAASPPWTAGFFMRKVLMMYGGSFHGQPQAEQIRRLLARKCQEYGKTTCALESAEIMAASLNRAYTLKSRVTFCLEPPGYGSERKAMVDALHLGCIPVLFLSEQDDELLWPYHWPQSVKSQTRVLIDPLELLSGRVDVRTVLQAITPEKVASMQAAIARHAPKMHYSRDDVEGDGFDVALRAILDGQRDQERLYASST